ncbi:MAG TPA: cytochrome P450 [Gammaproteobacteria bacterium]
MPAEQSILRRSLDRINESRIAAKYLWRGIWNILDAWAPELFETDFVHTRTFFRHVFVVSAPSDVEYVMVTNVENFPKSDVSQQMLKPLIGDSMFITHGAHWKRQRRLATPAFHTRNIREFTSVMVERTRAMVNAWEQLEEGGRIEIDREMTRLTAEIITGSLFSDDISGKTDQVYDAFARYQNSLGRLAVAELMGISRMLPRWGARKGKKAAEELDAIVWGIIERRQKSGEDKGDLLSLLLESRDPDTGGRLSERLIRDELLFLFLAGHETTASATIWTWYLLSQHPEVEARVHKEIDRVLSGRTPAYDDIANLKYIRAVLFEAMRLYPPVHVYARQNVEDDVIHGEHVPAGSLIVIAPWVIHRHKKLWDEPEAFRPDRFLGEKGRPRPRYDYLPFSAGPRTCLGLSFAMTEMAIVVAMVAQRFRLGLEPGHPVEPLGYLTLRPRFGLPMRITRRSRSPECN